MGVYIRVTEDVCTLQTSNEIIIIQQAYDYLIRVPAFVQSTSHTHTHTHTQTHTHTHKHTHTYIHARTQRCILTRQSGNCTWLCGSSCSWFPPTHIHTHVQIQFGHFIVLSLFWILFYLFFSCCLLLLMFLLHPYHFTLAWFVHVVWHVYFLWIKLHNYDDDFDDQCQCAVVCFFVCPLTNYCQIFATFALLFMAMFKQQFFPEVYVCTIYACSVCVCVCVCAYVRTYM